MSDWGLPILAPPQYLDKKVLPNSESVIKFYSTELGLNNNLKRITPINNFLQENTGEFLKKDASPSFPDPSLVRSEAWSNYDFVKSSKKRQWIQFKSKFMSCIKSVKFRFTALGILLGLILSLAALIPIVIIWQTSASNTSTYTNTTSSPSNSVIGSSLIAYTEFGICHDYYCEKRIIFITNMTTIALSLTVTIQRTENATYHGDWNNYNTVINSTYTISSTEIVYTFFLQSSQLPVGNYTCAVQFALPGQNHTTNIDKYSIKTTNVCGYVDSISRNF